jgi:hypothetical protein
MTVSDLTTDANIAYKLKMVGKLTPLLSYVGFKKGFYVFKPETDNKSTLKEQVVELFLATEDTVATGTVFIQCKFYGEWEKAPHVCGKDCPLES